MPVVSTRPMHLPRAAESSTVVTSRSVARLSIKPANPVFRADQDGNSGLLGDKDLTVVDSREAKFAWSVRASCPTTIEKSTRGQDRFHEVDGPFTGNRRPPQIGEGSDAEPPMSMDAKSGRHILDTRRKFLFDIYLGGEEAQ